jgi:GA4 desaturase
MRLHLPFPTLKTVAENVANPPTEPERCGIKFGLSTFDLTKPYVGGIKSDQKVGPARAVHIDFSPKGAGKMLRCLREDIREETGDIIAAEDKMGNRVVYEGRRYALYSIWRPLRTVRRDPIAVCDARTIDRERDLIEHVYKVPPLPSPSPFPPSPS